ncbi:MULTISPECIES: nucleoside deaminase [unclassified Paenibacillus]|uniref:nucleoside deaminase n=1 Tax=unclassified Paenibacillus TaxID=185978 RepID=UPI0013E3BCD4|nr:nucleoside deaminase [Paenibacillus sp. DCT19]MCM3172703.1 nucleoside deaminase [Paenibacillus sp. MER 99-2]
MWEKLSDGWKASFEEAWQAYAHGSIPIGAVIVDASHRIISRGRNRINETTAPIKQTCSNRLAHAEINALLQLDTLDSEEHKNYTLYTTTEPCVLCFGAIIMSGVRKVRFAATDPIAGGANLNDAENSFIKSRNLDIKCADTYLGELQRVLRTDQVIRALGEEQAIRFLDKYRMKYPKAIELGIKWNREGRLQEAVRNNDPVELIINNISDEIKTF